MSCTNLKTTTITITGQAQNAKAGAMVVSNTDNKMYYLDGIPSWDEQTIGQTVKVSGQLLIERFDPPKPDEPVRQQIVGEKRTIKHPKWEVVK